MPLAIIRTESLPIVLLLYKPLAFSLDTYMTLNLASEILIILSCKIA